MLTERVPWAERGSWFTRNFEDHVACFAREMSQQAVKNLVRVSWETVGNIVRSVMARLENKLGEDALDGLVNIGIDELSYRKHHQYVTVVTDHASGRTVWVSEGKGAETLDRFFDALGKARTGALKNITIDMSSAYISAIERRASKAQIVFDRFHVEQLAHRALDEVRRSEVCAIPKGDKKRALKKTRWALLKSAWNMSSSNHEKISEVQKKNTRLYRRT